MVSFIQEQNEIREDYTDEDKYQGKRFTWRYIVCNTALQGLIFIAAFAIVVPVLTYFLVVDRGSYKIVTTDTCYVNQTFRVPCGKVNISESDCVKIACCYDKPTQICYHYVPSRYSYDLNDGVYKVSRDKSPINTNSLNIMQMSINEIDSNKVSIYIHRETDTVYNGTLDVKKNYVVNNAEEKLMVEIFRENGDLLLSTAKGPLIASENYWEWTMYLTNQSLFGINQTLIKLDENSTFSKVFYNSKNDQSSIPLFWAYKNGKFHGVSINHDGPLEMTVLPSNMVVLKSITGGTIEIVLSVGPTPKLLHDQQRATDVVDLPYWVMGTHICQTEEKYYNMSYLLDQFPEELDLEADSYCIDDNLFTYLLTDVSNAGDKLKERLQKLSSQSKKFILSIPPQITESSSLYNIAKDLDLLYKFNDSIYQGTYLGQNVSYPDYNHPNIEQYLQEIDKFLLTYVNISIDGIILKDNWPSNENFVMDNVSFPYFNKDLQDALSYTIQWNTTGNSVSHILKHNSYGASQYKAFKNHYESINQSKVIISATKTISQIEPTIIENVDASWDNINHHLVNLLFNSIAGNHLVALPVCGDTSKYDETNQESLCLRWYIIAATMPLFRISSPHPWRNPDSMKSKYAQQITQEIVEKRNMLLPYYYAIVMTNEPVIRPMFYDYYENTITFSMNNQYMIGEKLLVAHPLTSGKTKLDIYLPPRIRVWYDFWDGTVFKTNKTNPYINIDILDTDFLIFVAQGSVVPMVIDDTINLVVALNCTKGVNIAEGSIQIEDLNIHFVATDDSVTVSSTSEVNYLLKYIKVYSYINDTHYLNQYYVNINLTETTTIYYDISTTTETTTIPTTTESESTSDETSTQTEPIISSSSSPSDSTATSQETVSTTDSTVTETDTITSSTSESTSDETSTQTEPTTISSSSQSESTASESTSQETVPTTDSTVTEADTITSSISESTSEETSTQTESTTISSSSQSESTASESTSQETVTTTSSTVTETGYTTSSPTEPTSDETTVTESDSTSTQTEPTTMSSSSLSESTVSESTSQESVPTFTESDSSSAQTEPTTTSSSKQLLHNIQVNKLYIKPHLQK